MKIAVIGVGLPWVGKSQVLVRLARERGGTYLCVGDIRREMRSANRSVSEAEIWEVVYRGVDEALARYDYVVVDAANVNASVRRRMITQLKLSADRIEAIWFRASVAYSISRRPDGSRITNSALRHMDRQLRRHPPSQRGDGIDLVTIRDLE